MNSVPKSIAVVIDAGFSGYGVIRSLGKRGIPVIGVDNYHRQFGLYSKYCRSSICPDPKKNEKKFINFLVGLGKSFDSKGILFPTSDSSVYAISKHSDKLNKYYILQTPRFEIIEKLVDKKQFYEVLDQMNMPCPKTFFINNLLQLESISKDIAYPCIIKPTFSGELQKKAYIFNCKEDLINSINVFKNKKLVLQDYVRGPSYGFCGYFNNKSEPIATFCHQRVRVWPYSVGNCCLSKSVYEPTMILLGTKFLQKIGYQGIFEVEFKKDLRDGEFKFIEVNARPWWQIRLSTRCGVDLPYIAYMDALGIEIEKQHTWKEGVKWINMANDVRSSLKGIHKGELSIKDWINSYRGENEFAVLDIEDPFPFIIHSYNLSLSALRHIF